MASRRGCIPTLRTEEVGSTGKILPGQHADAQPAHEVRLGEGALVEELLHQVLVALRHHLHELLAPGGGLFLHLRRHVHGLELAALVAGVDVGLADHEVGDAHEALLLAEGDRDGDHAAPEGGLQRVQGAREGRAVAVHAVDHHDAREAVLLGVGPRLLGLHLDPRHRVHHHQRAVRDPQGGDGLGEEVRVAGGVEEVDLGLAPLAPGDGGLEADLPLDLVGIEVGDGGAVLDAAEPVHRPGVEEDGGHERGLAAAAVAHDGHVADAGGLVDLHEPSRGSREKKADDMTAIRRRLRAPSA